MHQPNHEDLTVTTLARSIRIAAAVLASTGALAALPAVAADVPKPGCMAVKYHADFLKAYPGAPAGCQEVITNADGKKVVRFTAKVDKVAKDYVHLQFVDQVGMTPQGTGKLTLIPKPGQTVSVNGKQTEFSKLKRGDKLDFFIPEGALDFFSSPDGKQATTLVLP